MIAQNPGDGVGTDHALPRIPFGQFIRDAALAPGRMGRAEGHNLRFNGGISASRVFGSRTGKAYKRRIAARDKARLPIIERPTADMRGATGEHEGGERFATNSPSREYVSFCTLFRGNWRAKNILRRFFLGLETPKPRING